MYGVLGHPKALRVNFKVESFDAPYMRLKIQLSILFNTGLSRIDQRLPFSSIFMVKSVAT
jgi:hypothetical protein